MNYQTETIRQNEMPTTLNGYPVKAFTISRNADRALVLVHREGNFMPWVAASWWPELGDSWMWGNYFKSYEEADAYRANWISTHGNRADLPRIKIEGAIGGFQE